MSQMTQGSLMRLGVVCRGCLQFGIDVKLSKALLCEDYLTDIAGFSRESFSSAFLCQNCIRRMKKAVQFRDSVRMANQILDNLKETKVKVTLEWLTTMRQTIQDEPLAISHEILLEYNPQEEEGTIWEESVPDELSYQEVQVDPKEEEILVEGCSDHGDMEPDDTAADSHSLDPADVHFEVFAVEAELEEAGQTQQMDTEAKQEELDKSETEDRKEESVLFHCETCDSLISNREKYERHLRSHAQVSPYRCPLCSAYFQSSSSLEAHKPRHSMLFQCSLCDFKRREKSQVMKHYAVHHIGLTPDLQCPVCNIDLSERLMCLKSHRCLQEKVRCNNCNFETDRIALHQHEKIHRGEKRGNACTVCGRFFRYETALAQHMVKRHNEMSAQDEGSFYCVECDITFNQENSYKRHLLYTMKHASENLLKKCPQCDVRLLKGPLKRHMVMKHSTEPPYQCALCPKRLYTRRGLIGHQKHFHLKLPRSQDRKYICETCGRGFTSRQFLARHTNSHSGLRPFACRECDKTFGYDSSLYTHIMLVHRKMKRDSHGRFIREPAENSDTSKSRITLRELAEAEKSILKL